MGSPFPTVSETTPCAAGLKLPARIIIESEMERSD